MPKHWKQKLNCLDDKARNDGLRQDFPNHELDQQHLVANKRSVLRRSVSLKRGSSMSTISEVKTANEETSDKENVRGTSINSVVADSAKLSRYFADFKPKPNTEEKRAGHQEELEPLLAVPKGNHQRSMSSCGGAGRIANEFPFSALEKTTSTTPTSAERKPRLSRVPIALSSQVPARSIDEIVIKVPRLKDKPPVATSVPIGSSNPPQDVDISSFDASWDDSEAVSPITEVNHFRFDTSELKHVPQDFCPSHSSASSSKPKTDNSTIEHKIHRSYSDTNRQQYCERNVALLKQQLRDAQRVVKAILGVKNLNDTSGGDSSLMAIRQFAAMKVQFNKERIKCMGLELETQSQRQALSELQQRIEDLELQIQQIQNEKQGLLVANASLAREVALLKPLDGYSVAIIGAGPAGLLSAHFLLKAGASVDIFEARKDPRTIGVEEFSYAFYVNTRGQAAILAVDEILWEVVKARGRETAAVALYTAGMPINHQDFMYRGNKLVNPSVVLYQSDLCGGLLDELERRHKETGRLKIKFESKVCLFDLEAKTVTPACEQESQPFDLIVGADGINSATRSSIDTLSADFQAGITDIPGTMKVCRLPRVPPRLDQDSITFLVPTEGSTTGLVQPTKSGCCIVFSGGDGCDDSILSPNAVQNETMDALVRRFPVLEGCDTECLASQLASQRRSTMALVRCNTYHRADSAVLVGDAAHASGGVQGVNSALVDANVLGECLVQSSRKNLEKVSCLKSALLKFSQRRVPEGTALYDLVIGPQPKSWIGRVRYWLKITLDTVFKGRLGIGSVPLSIQLTQSAKPFADLRRELSPFFTEKFPDQEAFDKELADLSGS